MKLEYFVINGRSYGHCNVFTILSKDSVGIFEQPENTLLSTAILHLVNLNHDKLRWIQ